MELTPESRDNYLCIKKLDQSSHLKGLYLSEISHKALHHLYSNLHRKWDSTPMSWQILPSKSDSLDFMSNKWFSYIPKQIQREIHTMNHHYTYTCNIQSRAIRVQFILNAPSLKFRQNALIKIVKWLHYVLPSASSQCAKTLDIYLIMTQHKKWLPTKENWDSALLSEIHANTAFTTSCSENCEIFVYRQEDWFKVLIHETFHALGLDFSHLDVSKSNADIVSTFPAIERNTDIRLYETYSEMWAEIINVLFLCGPHRLTSSRIPTRKNYRRSIKRADIKGGFKSVTTLLQYERIYSVYQANKVLRHYGLTYADLFSKKNGSYREKTNAFSYFIIKSICMWNLDEFVKWCVSHNGNQDGILSLQFNTNNVDKYVELVNHLAKAQSYKEAITEMEDTSSSTLDLCSRPMSRTLRMCLFEGKHA
jgi:hypothetical protein